MELLAKFEIKSPAVSAWVSKALKESHKDEIYYNETAIKELNRSHEQTQNRLDRLYDDKLDGKISESFYEQKFKQYAQEKEATVEAIKKHSQADTKYLQLGMNLYELSQRGREVYWKASMDDKRALIRLVFEDLKLRDGELAVRYTRPFQVLLEMVSEINRSKVVDFAASPAGILEPHEKPLHKGKDNDIIPLRSALLPEGSSTATIIHAPR